MIYDTVMYRYVLRTYRQYIKKYTVLFIQYNEFPILLTQETHTSATLWSLEARGAYE